MKISYIRWIGLTALQLVLLSGCASYPPQSNVYYVVPCSTPGAIPSGTPRAAISVPSITMPPADAGSASGATPAPPNAIAEANSSDPPVCVAVAGVGRAASTARYYPYGYPRRYGPGYYSGPFYGSFGFTYLSGGHFGGGHFGGGHFGGRHIGGGHLGGGHIGGGHFSEEHH